MTHLYVSLIVHIQFVSKYMQLLSQVHLQVEGLLQTHHHSLSSSFLQPAFQQKKQITPHLCPNSCHVFTFFLLKKSKLFCCILTHTVGSLPALSLSSSIPLCSYTSAAHPWHSVFGLDNAMVTVHVLLSPRDFALCPFQMKPSQQVILSTSNILSSHLLICSLSYIFYTYFSINYLQYLTPHVRKMQVGEHFNFACCIFSIQTKKSVT